MAKIKPTFKSKTAHISYLEDKLKSHRKLSGSILVVLILFVILMFSFDIDMKFVGLSPYTRVIDGLDNKTFYVYVNQTGNVSDVAKWYNQTSEISSIEPCNEKESEILLGLKAFFDKMFSDEHAWLYSFFVFLGIVYFLQVSFNVAGDIIELALVLIVFCKRVIEKIIRKVKPQKNPVYHALINVKGGKKNNDKIRRR